MTKKLLSKEPLALTPKVKQYFEDFEYLAYVGTYKGLPAYKYSEFSLYDLEHAVLGPPNYLVIVDPDDLSETEFYAWYDANFHKELVLDPPYALAIKEAKEAIRKEKEAKKSR